TLITSGWAFLLKSARVIGHVDFLAMTFLPREPSGPAWSVPGRCAPGVPACGYNKKEPAPSSSTGKVRPPMSTPPAPRLSLPLWNERYAAPPAPATRAELAARGWEWVDVVLVTGDAYV